MKILSFAVLALAAGVWLLPAAPSLSPVSAPAIVSLSAAGPSFGPSFSGDGRFLLFVSPANNLVAADNRLPFLDVFVRDLLTGENSLVSANLLNSGGGNGSSNFPVISHAGDWIAFVSAASNLVTNDVNGKADIFARHRVSGQTRLVTVDSSGAASATGSTTGASARGFLSGWPGLSSDGRWVVFRSRATNLTSLPDGNGEDDVFVRDLETATTRLVSVNAAGTQAASGRSSCPAISADGRKVVFISSALDIVGSVTNQLDAVYVRDLTTEAASWASSDLPFEATLRCSDLVLSGDGSTIVFTAQAINGAGSWLCRRVLGSGVLSVIATNTPSFGLPAVSKNGEAVAFEHESNPSASPARAIYLWRAPGGTTELVSGSNGVAVGSAGWPTISTDGRFVGYIADVPQGLANRLITHVFLRDTLLQTTQLITVGPTGRASQNSAEPVPPTFHPIDFRLAFASSADDLVSGDYNQASDLFLRDPANGSTELLTLGQSALPALTGPQLSALGHNGLSSDGRFILFRTSSTNLVALTTNTLSQETALVVVRDRLSQTNSLFDPGMTVFDVALSLDGQSVAFTTLAQVYSQNLPSGTRRLVGVFENGAPPFSATFRNPVVNRDGTLVAFEASGVSSFWKGVYLRDLSSNSASLVSVTPGPPANGNRASSWPQFSPDSHWVLFQSLASDLTSDFVDGSLTHLFARDLKNNQTILLSKYDGNPLTANSEGAVISANSRQVAFANGTNRVFVYDLQTLSNRLACTGCREPSLNAEGTLLAYESFVNAGPAQISLQNLSAQTTELISVNHLGTGGGNGRSRAPVLGGNGRFVVFLSAATDLVPNDDNGETDLFLRDTLTHTTFLLSPGKEDYPGGSELFRRAIASLTGQTIFFQSFASRLSLQDYNNTADIFALELGVGDTDHDSLDDGWEVAYFNDLQRDGSGDFDHDGTSDREEYLSGTNPADYLGFLAITAWVRWPDGSVTLYWSSIPGRNYRVQMKTSLEVPAWSELPGEIVAGSSTSSYSAPPGDEAQRFYRVVLQP